jgi:hypothetical protein
LFELFKERPAHDEYQMNVRFEDLRKNLDKIRKLSRYVFDQFQQQLGEKGKLLIVMDGDRRAIYDGKDLSKQEASIWLAAIAEDARSMNIPVLELGPVFYEDYKKYGKRFDFPHDYHWNVRGHELVGHEIADFLEKEQWIR